MSEREHVIDFTVPYYDLVGITIMMKKPKVTDQVINSEYVWVILRGVLLPILGQCITLKTFLFRNLDFENIPFWFSDCLIVRLSNCPIARLSDCQIVR